MTWSIVARGPAGEFGIAIASRFFAVGMLCPHTRSGDKPFARIEDVIGRAELVALSENYKRVAGFERDSLARRASLV